MQVRPTQRSDIACLQSVLTTTGLFPSEILPDLIEGFLSDEACPDIWLTCESDSTPVGFCYAVPEELAAGTWNMRAIAVMPDMQGRGCGTALVKQLEAELKAHGQRILIADTSGTEAFAGTRAFYRKTGYHQEARIRDFWATGDDKIVFWTSLL